jgi:hypothetical protein
MATPENVADMKRLDSTGTMFERADYGRSYATLTGYTPSAVWAWLVHGEEVPRIIAYNDI